MKRSPVSDKEIAVGYIGTNVKKDLLAIMAVSLGVTLAVGGIFLIISDMTTVNPLTVKSTTKSMANIIDMFPGVPFSMSWPYDLVSSGITTVGLVTWIMGIDILLVGLGLWTRHKLAKMIGIVVFGLATCFDFMQFLFFGVSGAPVAVFGAVINGLIVYLLLTN
jgi:hypothetical protein